MGGRLAYFYQTGQLIIGGIRISPRASLHTSPKEVAKGTGNGRRKVSSPLKGDRSTDRKESSNPSPSSKRKCSLYQKETEHGDQ